MSIIASEMPSALAAGQKLIYPLQGHNAKHSFHHLREHILNKNAYFYFGFSFPFAK